LIDSTGQFIGKGRKGQKYAPFACLIKPYPDGFHG